MKEINYHSSNLLSFSTINLTYWKDRIIFKKIIETLFRKKNMIYFFGQRPENSIFINNINNMNLIYYDEKYFDIILSFNKSSDFYIDNLELCTEYWTRYEQAIFLFSDDRDLIGDKKYLRKSWKDLVSLSDSFILFKGIEENVTWIGKSELINFPDFNELKDYSPKLR